MRPIIFCDFDGTVTNSDNIIALMKQFAAPEWEAIAEAVLSKRISIREGVGNMFSLLESGQKEKYIDFLLEHTKIREGFAEFIDFVKENEIRFYIISGGMDFFIEPILKPFDLKYIYCNNAKFDEEFIRIEWPNSCDDKCSNDCGCCKPSIMRNLAGPDDFTIVIGDSITDLEAAKKADLVLARDFLKRKCEQEGIAHLPFETFHDCKAALKNRLEVII
ncbi:2-hydroxy-3-keto-5-methylthiopentenyl-1-phosphate phosphatase [Peribacillus saganii]|uniref:2-hydroxy-3-keto-5-methylthiopentenyl-1-phosphate phosphatase n=1 Tax=Peribacillus saganii TaxID=2303992 RepID=A0A372LU02_9BACI|nr:2-hydroxy-3-keto-5-methylthiopentenyl-1-phosphate phosphatase [Peribacillus saganii]RFU71034.1 2-hydroxy-3-keto-5-methylthiopentenyl-1-phosphate phosphatase [Peribacillus saganii]